MKLNISELKMKKKKIFAFSIAQELTTLFVLGAQRQIVLPLSLSHSFSLNSFSIILTLLFISFCLPLSFFIFLSFFSLSTTYSFCLAVFSLYHSHPVWPNLAKFRCLSKIKAVLGLFFIWRNIQPILVHCYANGQISLFYMAKYWTN